MANTKRAVRASRNSTDSAASGFKMNRSLSVRSNRKDGGNGSGAGGSAANPPRHRFTMATLRGMQQPELSRKLFKLIKTENHAISAHENAGRERVSVATQLSDWGESTGDEAISEISDKLGVLMAEMGEQESSFAERLEDYRATLKDIRDIEAEVQPSRDHRGKVTNELQKVKIKDPQSARVATLEQELVRLEAENLVAEAQLTNMTRQKFKEAYASHFAAVIERAEKQAILARHARRLLNIVDDSAMAPGEMRAAFEGSARAGEIIDEAEDELRHWRANLEPVTSAASLQKNLMPTGTTTGSQVGAGGGAGRGPGGHGDGDVDGSGNGDGNDDGNHHGPAGGLGNGRRRGSGSGNAILADPHATQTTSGHDSENVAGAGYGIGHEGRSHHVYQAMHDDSLQSLDGKDDLDSSPDTRVASGSTATGYPASEADSHAALV